VEAGEAGLAGEELLHGGLFEVALLGDEPGEGSEQGIHIAQRLCDGALFGEGWGWKMIGAQDTEICMRNACLNRAGHNLFLSLTTLKAVMHEVRIMSRMIK